MRRRIALFMIATILLLGLYACNFSGTAQDDSSAEPELTYQDYYDLGVRYLSEGNYQEAIIAFTAAIEIDPKQAPAYVGRGDAYVKSGETESNLTAAKADYEKAIEMDNTVAQTYLKLAEIYQKQGDEEAAKQILQQGFAATSSEELQNRILELSKLKPKEGYPKTERMDWGGSDKYSVIEYDKYGQNVHEIIYNVDGTISQEIISEYNEWGNHVYQSNQADTSWTEERFFDNSDRVIEWEGSYIGKNWIVKYDYANCPTVIISVHIRNSYVFINNKEEFDVSITYQMQDATHTVDAGGAMGREGDNYYTTVGESGPGKYGFRKLILATDYWEDGSIRQTRRYDENGNLLP